MGNVGALMDYCSPVMNTLQDKRGKKNFSNLLEQVFSKHHIQLWRLSDEKKTYNRFRDMLNGSLVNGI